VESSVEGHVNALFSIFVNTKQEQREFSHLNFEFLPEFNFVESCDNFPKRLLAGYEV